MATLHKLTIKEIQNLEPAQKEGAEKSLSDGGGLYILARRLKGGNVARYFAFWRFDKGIKKRLGIYPELTLKQARNLAAVERSRLEGLKGNKQGYNMTFKEAFEQFAEHFISVNNLSAASQASLKSVYSSQLIALENFKLTDITKRVLLKLFEDLTTKQNRAEQVYQWLNRFFKHAIHHDILSINIMEQIDLKSIIGKKKETKHAPHLGTIAEVKELKERVISSDFKLATRQCFLPALYIATRSAEARKACWDETHINPCEAMCDGPNMLSPDSLKSNLDEIKRIKDALGE